MPIHSVGRSILSEKSSITITDAKSECSCKIGIKLDVRNGTVLGISGIYWLLRHYNYNNKPVYYRSGACSILSICHEKELHLYYGNIDGVSGRKRNGWQIHSEFGWEYSESFLSFRQAASLSIVEMCNSRDCINHFESDQAIPK